jgi:DNA-binding response OmpR family regulator
MPPVVTRVLIIEDDSENREALAAFLAAGGFQVGSAGTGAEGVALFAERPFDVVLTDLRLADLDGFAVAREIKAVAPKTPIALVTGWRLDLEPEELAKRGIDLVITKPIEPSRFLAQVAALGARGEHGGASLLGDRS